MRIRHFTRAAAISTALVLSVAAQAGEAERARQAIAEAQGKIDAGDKAGANGEAALLQAQARTALQSAEDRLSRGRKEEAITDAHHASELADRAIVIAGNRRVGAEREGRMNAEASAAAAQQSAADAHARADAAQASAANANAQADALRNQPPVVVAVPAAPAAPAPMTTTTTVATVDRDRDVATTAPVRHVVRHRPVRHTHHVVHHTVPGDKTTTTVTTQQQ